jgi:hypothetical protein
MGGVGVGRVEHLALIDVQGELVHVSVRQLDGAEESVGSALLLVPVDVHA